MKAKFRYESARNSCERVTFTNIKAKPPRLTHEEVDDAVAAFLSKGGAVEQIPSGESGRKDDSHYRFRLPNSSDPFGR